MELADLIASCLIRTANIFFIYFYLRTYISYSVYLLHDLRDEMIIMLICAVEAVDQVSGVLAKVLIERGGHGPRASVTRYYLCCIEWSRNRLDRMPSLP